MPLPHCRVFKVGDERNGPSKLIYTRPTYFQNLPVPVLLYISTYIDIFIIIVIIIMVTYTLIITVTFQVTLGLSIGP